ncbi:hypothetical protein ACFPL7_24235 [Dongia soli]|uniref:Uncharacterized protein n=1 Tax=Dongia soli TaxID=600628 RepID=A0ABU5EJP3_9PROT|nr:hypothetical protein [Dongia soli]MDY0885411.1 hypothetical protein [Dongia soli]
MKKALMVREELERFLAVKMRAYSETITAVAVIPINAEEHGWIGMCRKFVGIQPLRSWTPLKGQSSGSFRGTSI